ncbi:hypothetical protein AHAS_Ahas02G0013100 [Arachis hypogaea]
MRYVLGLQIMVQLQCEALFKEFKVTPLICGLMSPIWLRFVFGTGVFNDDWADKVIHDSEMQHEEEEPEDHKTRAKYREEPHNLYGQRAVMIWFRALKKRIPPSWKIPYISAFVEIERCLGRPSSACPISSGVMLMPQRVLMVLKLETFAASIAQFIGLELPPVNFFGIVHRYLQRLSLPSEKILPHEHELDTSGLLQHLQTIYSDLANTQEYSKDLASYLKHCRDVVFARSEASYGNYEEEKMIEYLWNSYKNEKNWSLNAVYETTWILSSTTKAQSFYKLVLLPGVRDYISKN